MATKKTSILVEVDEVVYDLVIAPHKKNKTFSKLVATLLKGYIENELIRGYADDTLDDMRKASVDALDSMLDTMRSSLANMGMYTEDLRSNSESGANIFGARAEEAKEDIKANSVGMSAEEAEEMRSSMKELKEQNSQIIEMLKSFSNTPQTVYVQAPQPVATQPIQTSQPVVQQPVVNISENQSKLEEQEVVKPKDTVQEDYSNSSIGGSSFFEEDEEDLNVDAEDAMADLLKGNMYSF